MRRRLATSEAIARQLAASRSDFVSDFVLRFFRRCRFNMLRGCHLERAMLNA